MIDWLIEHYAEIAVYSGIVGTIIGIVAVVVIAVLKAGMRRDMRQYFNNMKKR